MDLNKFIGVGKLGRDPEFKYTPSGKLLGNFSVAINSGWGDKKKTDWIDVTVWEKTAEFLNGKILKGSEVYIEGEVHVESWISKKDGSAQAKIVMPSAQVKIVGKWADGGTRASRDEFEPAGPDVGDGDNIPF